MKTIFLIGHRGVGKTRVLKDYHIKNKQTICYDLDEQIELRTGLKILDLFNNGESKKFRKLEIQVLDSLIKEFNENIKSYKLSKNNSQTLVVAIGAGFNLEAYSFPKQSLILWLRKVSDKDGRILLIDQL